MDESCSLKSQDSTNLYFFSTCFACTLVVLPHGDHTHGRSLGAHMICLMLVQGACCTAFVNGQRASTAPDLEKLLQEAAARKGQTSSPSGHGNDTMQHFPFDHIYKHLHAAGDPFPQTHSDQKPSSASVPGAEGEGASVAVLYGMFGTSCFRDMHALLASAVRDSSQPGRNRAKPAGALHVRALFRNAYS